MPTEQATKIAPHEKVIIAQGIKSTFGDKIAVTEITTATYILPDTIRRTDIHEAINEEKAEGHRGVALSLHFDHYDEIDFALEQSEAGNIREALVDNYCEWLHARGVTIIGK